MEHKHFHSERLLHLLMTGGLFRGGFESTVTGRSLPPARFALDLPDEECPTIELDPCLLSSGNEANSPKPPGIPSSTARPIPAMSVKGAKFAEALAGMCIPWLSSSFSCRENIVFSALPSGTNRPEPSTVYLTGEGSRETQHDRRNAYMIDPCTTERRRKRFLGLGLLAVFSLVGELIPLARVGGCASCLEVSPFSLYSTSASTE